MSFSEELCVELAEENNVQFFFYLFTCPLSGGVSVFYSILGVMNWKPTLVLPVHSTDFELVV